MLTSLHSNMQDLIQEYGAYEQAAADDEVEYEEEVRLFSLPVPTVTKKSHRSPRSKCQTTLYLDPTLLFRFGIPLRLVSL